MTSRVTSKMTAYKNNVTDDANQASLAFPPQEEGPAVLNSQETEAVEDEEEGVSLLVRLSGGEDIVLQVGHVQSRNAHLRRSGWGRGHAVRGWRVAQQAVLVDDVLWVKR